MRTSYSLHRNFAFAELANFLTRNFFLSAEAVDLFDHQKDGERNYKKTYDVIQKHAVTDCCAGRKGDFKRRKIDVAQNKSERRHYDIVDQGINNFAERSADDNAHGQIDRIPPYRKLLKLF